MTAIGLLAESATASAAPTGGKLLRSAAIQHARERHGGAGADRRDVETHDRGRQQPHIGEHRVAASDTGRVVEQRDLVGAKQRPQTVRLFGRRGLAEAEEQIRDMRRKAGVLEGFERRDGLHQGLAGAAGFRDGDEARLRERQLRQHGAIGLRIEIVHEMQPRPLAQQAHARHRMARELSQRLAAEARSAGAENHDVAGALPQTGRGGLDGGDIAALGGHAQER
jgi:hypothetical protein